ncbi:DNA glycosylase [Phellopilus nigrolimitatus]|nr:DNA glycosylase [Phellopilus nigrolimitatus]
MARKRSASTARLSLVARPSPYDAAVTLFDAAETSPNGFASPRRSTRTRKVVEYAEVEAEEAEDSEDAAPPAPADVSPQKRRRANAGRLPREQPPPPSPAKKRKAAVAAVKVEEADIEDAVRPVPAGVSEPARTASASPRKSKPLRTALAAPHPAPARWEEAYAAVREMRARFVAPVDTMGCASAQLHEIDPVGRRVSTLVSLMLSSQTKDEVTAAATERLRAALGGSITVPALVAADASTISSAIASVGFWRRKTQYVKQAALRLRDDFACDVPQTVDELCSLPGVGPKMAFLCLQAAWNINDGIGVDVHVHRITNRFGWHVPPSKNPEETRLNLQSWLPKALHPEINHLLVGFGQTICLPVGPRCADCALSSDAGLCPSAQAPRAKQNRARKALLLRADADARAVGLKAEEAEMFSALAFEVHAIKDEKEEEKELGGTLS